MPVKANTPKPPYYAVIFTFTRHSAPILSKLIIYDKKFKSTFNSQ